MNRDIFSMPKLLNSTFLTCCVFEHLSVGLCNVLDCASSEVVDILNETKEDCDPSWMKHDPSCIDLGLEELDFRDRVTDMSDSIWDAAA